MDICDKYLNGEEITGAFYEHKLQKTSQSEFRIEKLINGKVMIIHLIVGLISQIYYKI